MKVSDLIVVGTGGVGSSVACHAAARGLQVLGLDRYSAGHDQGSSHGETRIIRQAYFEHPDYVPLLRRAYEGWSSLEDQVGQQLFYPVGLLQVGPADGQVVPGVLRSAREHQLDVEALTAPQISAAFPGFVADDEWTGVFERRAGYLLVEQCVRAYLGRAEQLGAVLRTGIQFLGWRQSGQGLTVLTDQGDFETARLVITAGPWAPQVLRDLSLDLHVRRKHLYWFETLSDCYHEQRRAPTFLFETADGVYYGFPQRDSAGVKVAEHTGGVVVEDPRADPRVLDPADRHRVEQFLRRQLPEVSARLSRHAVCFYTMSPDEHFVVDRHPTTPHVVFAAGLSGHGFKFTSVLGEALVELACDGASRHPIGFLRRRR